MRDLKFYNFWSFVHEVRTDWAMLLSALFLLIAGASPFSLDRLLAGRTSRLNARDEKPSAENPSDA